MFTCVLQSHSRKKEWVIDRWNVEIIIALWWNILLSLRQNYKTELKTEFLRERFWIVSWEPLKDFFQHFFWKKNFTAFNASLQNKIFLLKRRCKDTDTERHAFRAVLVFNLLSRKVLFINRRDNRHCCTVKTRLRFEKIANFKGKLLHYTIIFLKHEMIICQCFFNLLDWTFNAFVVLNVIYY